MFDPIDYLKIMADETRLRIMILLYKEELCVCELVGILKMSQPNISKHLKKLRELDCVCDSKKENYVKYKINKDNKYLMDILKLTYNKCYIIEPYKKDLEGLLKSDEFLSKCIGRRKSD
jgi:ArsR family transcriptional regulator